MTGQRINDEATDLLMDAVVSGLVGSRAYRSDWGQFIVEHEGRTIRCYVEDRTDDAG